MSLVVTGWGVFVRCVRQDPFLVLYGAVRSVGTSNALVYGLAGLCTDGVAEGGRSHGRLTAANTTAATDAYESSALHDWLKSSLACFNPACISAPPHGLLSMSLLTLRSTRIGPPGRCFLSSMDCSLHTSGRRLHPWSRTTHTSPSSATTPPHPAPRRRTPPPPAPPPPWRVPGSPDASLQQ
jgi:hypothetical protein